MYSPIPRVDRNIFSQTGSLYSATLKKYLNVKCCLLFAPADNLDYVGTHF